MQLKLNTDNIQKHAMQEQDYLQEAQKDIYILETEIKAKYGKKKKQNKYTVLKIIVRLK